MFAIKTHRTILEMFYIVKKVQNRTKDAIYLPDTLYNYDYSDTHFYYDTYFYYNTDFKSIEPNQIIIKIDFLKFKRFVIVLSLLLLIIIKQNSY